MHDTSEFTSHARDIVEGILEQKPGSHVHLYQGLRKFCWPIFRERLSEDDSLDRLQDLYIKVSEAIEEHRIEHPEFVFAYARTTALRMLGERKEFHEERMAA